MRNLSSAVLSLAAMVMSSLTTYLTFFDSRYTMTAAIADVDGQIQTGSSSSETGRTINFRRYLTPSVILSNRGTRALVLTDVRLIESSSVEACDLNEEATNLTVLGGVKPTIIEPDSVQELSFEFGLPDIGDEQPLGRSFNVAPTDSGWCLQWTVFDPNGKRHEPTMLAVRESTTFALDGDGDLEATYHLDHPNAPVRLVTRGLY